MVISRMAARLLALQGQMLNRKKHAGLVSDLVAEIIRELGYIQIDTISVVARAHHHTLWTRCPEYEPDILHRLLAQEKRVFEYWGHAASILPMEDFRFTLPRKMTLAASESSWMKHRRAQAGHLLKPVLKRIRDEGPLSSKDFETAPEQNRGTWWDWKPAKMALEILFWQGDLMVRERRNFQKVYDLTERVLPEDVDQTMPTEDEYGRFLVRRALQAYGIAQEKDILKHLHSGTSSPAAAALKALVSEGVVAQVKVEDENRPSFVLGKTLDDLAVLQEPPPSAWLLSPFDNLVIQRDRLARLFNFEYSLECYLPAAKRRYGYFVLPILFGHSFVGRMDVKAERASGTLQIQGFWLEIGVSDDDSIWDEIGKTLIEFMRFNRCERIQLGEQLEWKIAARLRIPIKAGGIPVVH
ncbi:MAG: YcaQ family DNA glycosylase [Anaerolineales bacterium]|nr:YcaQ family DNA glycosylase [Anaerolineales bacterium]